MNEEIRVTDPTTGGQKGSKPARFDLIPAAQLAQVAEVYGRGATKYDDRNWERGYDWGLSFASLMRHAWAFWGGEYTDPEGGFPHLAAVIFHAFALMKFNDDNLGTDTRKVITDVRSDREEPRRAESSRNARSTSGPYRRTGDAVQRLLGDASPDWDAHPYRSRRSRRD